MLCIVYVVSLVGTETRQVKGCRSGDYSAPLLCNCGIFYLEYLLSICRMLSKLFETCLKLSSSAGIKVVFKC